MEKDRIMKFDMKKNILIIIAIAFFGNVFGQSTKDPKAKAILDKALKGFSSLESFSSEFSFVKHVPSLEDETYSGNIKFKEKKVYLNSSDGREVFNDGKTLSIYYKEDNEVNIYTSDPEQNEDFAIDKYLKAYQNDYKYIYMGTQTINGIVCDFIELSPDKTAEEMAKQSVFKIKLFIDQKTGLVVQWKVFEKSGIIYTTTISKFVPNVIFSDSVFVFNKANYPDVEVMDMRE
jgi:outer membrane lipoprotein-sorting protein